MAKGPAHGQDPEGDRKPGQAARDEPRPHGHPAPGEPEGKKLKSQTGRYLSGNCRRDRPPDQEGAWDYLTVQAGIGSSARLWYVRA